MASDAISLNPLFEFDTIKHLADSSTLKALPAEFKFANEVTHVAPASLPAVDFAALMAADSDIRSKAVEDLATACREWRCFILVNHGIPESLMDAMLTAIREFFSLPKSEIKKYAAKSALDPIQCGNYSVTNASNQTTYALWRDYLKLDVHPEFHCPQQPRFPREVVQEYSERVRKLARKLLEAVCDTLDLDHDYLDEALKMESSFQLLVANYYPPCPQPDQAIGIPPHTDTGLISFLINNGVPGLQVERDGQWFSVDVPPNSIMVSVDDHLEIFSNGKLKSLKHRAMVNEERERISIVMVNGPWRKAIVSPAAALVEKDGRAMYGAMEYDEFLETQLTKSRISGIPLLEKLRIDYTNIS